MSTDILLSLRSLSSFFLLSLSESFEVDVSLALFESLFSLSECKLLLELEPLSNDGRPKLNTDDFLCDVLTEGDVMLVSCTGEWLSYIRTRVDELPSPPDVGEGGGGIE